MILRTAGLKKGAALFLLTAWVGLAAAPATAQVRFTGNALTGDEPPTLQMFEGIVYDITRAVFALAGVGAFVYLIVGGFKYITAGGDPKALGDAQKAIAYAAIGLVITASLYFILKVVSETFYGGGLNLLRFSLPAPSAPTP